MWQFCCYKQENSSTFNSISVTSAWVRSSPRGVWRTLTMRFHLSDDLMLTQFEPSPIESLGSSQLILREGWWGLVLLEAKYLTVEIDWRYFPLGQTSAHHMMRGMTRSSFECQHKAEGLHPDVSSGCQVGASTTARSQVTVVCRCSTCVTRTAGRAGSRAPWGLSSASSSASVTGQRKSTVNLPDREQEARPVHLFLFINIWSTNHFQDNKIQI